tara:strand:+ start:58 stop:993 length:936 start_codon:yes stop_codon:yes gene_type:complete
MEEINNTNKDIDSNISSENIDINQIILKLWHGRNFILIITSVFSIVAVIYSLSLPNVYRSQALLAEANSNNSISSSLDQFSSLAGIAGISLPSSGEADEVEMGIAVIKSLDFFEGFATKYDIWIPLVASIGWDSMTNELLLDDDIYNKNEERWTQDKPSIQSFHGAFLERLNISRSKQTGFVQISIEHHSPYIASFWLESIIKEINEITRLEDMKVANASIEFLENEIEGTKLIEVRSSLNGLIQDQIQKRMVANATPEYLFKILASPFAPEKKYSPRRSLICIFGFLMGILVSFSYILFGNYLKKLKELD